MLFVAVAALALLDLLADLREGTTAAHVAFEGGVVVAGVAGLLLGLRRIRALRIAERQARAEVANLDQRLAAVRQDAERWRTEAKDLLQGLGAAIERQLVRWELTAAEHDVALLLLKGLSHKQVAEMRGSSEATVRQQARGVYRKAGVEGRHDLAAFFLEGVLAPASDVEGLSKNG
ncbi:MAG: response regulator transcription factor [Planctomycetes bacterium]|nr:response regulator transcription factor [Planctomycetota bacterium]